MDKVPKDIIAPISAPTAEAPPPIQPPSLPAADVTRTPQAKSDSPANPPAIEAESPAPQSPAVSGSSSPSATTADAPRSRRPSALVVSNDAPPGAPSAGSSAGSAASSAAAVHFAATPASRSTRTLQARPSPSFRRAPSASVPVALGRWLPPAADAEVAVLRADLQALDRDGSGTLPAASLRKAAGKRRLGAALRRLLESAGRAAATDAALNREEEWVNAAVEAALAAADTDGSGQRIRRSGGVWQGREGEWEGERGRVREGRKRE